MTKDTTKERVWKRLQDRLKMTLLLEKCIRTILCDFAKEWERAWDTGGGPARMKKPVDKATKKIMGLIEKEKGE